MTLRFDRTKLPMAVTVGILACSALGACSSRDVRSEEEMLRRVARTCTPIVEAKIECEDRAIRQRSPAALLACSNVKPNCYDTYEKEGGSISKKDFTRVEGAIRNSVAVGSNSTQIETAVISTHNEITGAGEDSPIFTTKRVLIGLGVVVALWLFGAINRFANVPG